MTGKILFRVDGDQTIGSGHIMRCLTLADRLQAFECQSTFVCRKTAGSLSEWIQERGHQLICLPVANEPSMTESASGTDSQYREWLGTTWQIDAEQTRRAIGDSHYDWLVVDHYALDASWEKCLKAHCNRTLVIDDLANRHHDCDLLLDQNLVPDLQTRYAGKVPERCGLLLGPEYAVMHRSYAEHRQGLKTRRPPVRQFLAYFGGADSSNLTGRTIEAFRGLDSDNLRLAVVIPAQSPWVNECKTLAGGDWRISLYHSLPTLADLMVQSDVAVGACGTTAWERCCLGLPSLVITLADNQVASARELHRQGLVRWLGNHDGVTMADLRCAMQDCLSDDSLESWSNACAGLVDGQGATRVATWMMLNPQMPVRTRPVEFEDEGRILDWANDRVVRANAFHPEKIDPDTHRNWFHHQLKQWDKVRFLIVETAESIPVGQVRFSQSSGVWEIHYSLDPKARGRRMGAVVLQAGLERLASEFEDVEIIGRVKANNMPSVRVFESLGFDRQSSHDGTEFVFRKTLSRSLVH